MKKSILTSIFVLTLLSGFTQMQNDIVSLTAGYSNQTWYSLENGEIGSEPKDNWDIAFDVSAFGTSIHINSITGTTLYTYPLGNTSAWATIDTAGISTWTTSYNSEITWAIGAFDQGVDSNNPFDVGWGIYNTITHVVTGDSLFVIKLSNGEYKKLWINNLAGGGYNFQYADLNGDNAHSHFLSKADHAGKNFGYYSLQNNAAVDREPAISSAWDLLFTQYTSFIPVPYTVAGVLSNKGVLVAQATEIADVENYNEWSSHDLNTDINTIGYDWKAFTGGVWAMEESWVYFVQSRPGDIWKVIFTDFGGSANGNYVFSKEKLSTVGINDTHNEQSASMAVYPNPVSNSETVSIIYSLQNAVYQGDLSIHDTTGRNIYSSTLNKTAGLHTYPLQTSDFNSGMYIVSILVDGQILQQKLVIR